ncbi:MAG: PilZ domain-containing protein [Desulfobulbaceae bacterium]|nr:MAG: PilZ domain-containing protein [Desulfobulbaceae bacterium]
MQHPEQRTKTRIKFETSVSLEIDELSLAANTLSRDMSLDGIFIRTGEQVPLNVPCLVTITITGTSSNLTMRIKGRTIRQDRSGVAVRFTELEMDSYLHLKNIVLNNQVPDSGA